MILVANFGDGRIYVCDPHEENDGIFGYLNMEE